MKSAIRQSAILGLWAFLLLWLHFGAAVCLAQENDPGSLFPHPDSARYWLSLQSNFILQGHPPFRSPYEGPNSLSASGQGVMSRLITLYGGLQLSYRTELVVDVEHAGGHGIGAALGLAGFTNLDVVRTPSLGQAPYFARYMVRHIIPLSSEMVDADRDPLSLATRLPARMLEIRAGKFSLPDFMDLNAVGSDSHLQFMNWTVDNNGAWDYAANTRGYTEAVMLHYQDREWGVRFAEALMPKEANGPVLDWDLARAHSENLEFHLERGILPGRHGAVRLLGYINHADMGNYREAINAFLAGRTPRPDIVAARRQGRVKYGFGLNVEQSITPTFRAFARLGWNDGRNESFAYTEVDRTAAGGWDLAGTRWHRPKDKIGFAFVSNRISGDHRRYLALGGLGFVLGDGRLTYGPETIIETYYRVFIYRGLSLSFDYQRIWNPGYNQDRGPVDVFAGRFHIDL